MKLFARVCVVGALVMVGLGAQGCSSSSDAPEDDGGGAGSGGRGGSGGTGGQSGSGGRAPGPVQPIEGDALTRLPCSDVCAGKGLSCAVRCTNVGFVHRSPAGMQVAGWAMYSSKTTNSSINDDRYVTSCSERFEPECGKTFSTTTPWECPPGSLSQSGPPYRLQRFTCCCE